MLLSHPVALSRSFDIVKIFFMLIILYMCYQIKSVDTLLKIGMWSRLYSLFYTVYFYGLDYFITVLSSSARIANDALNANTVVGLLGANAIVKTLYTCCTIDLVGGILWPYHTLSYS